MFELCLNYSVTEANCRRANAQLIAVKLQVGTSPSGEEPPRLPYVRAPVASRSPPGHCCLMLRVCVMVVPQLTCQYGLKKKKMSFN